MAEATFQPAIAPGGIVDAGFAGMNQAMSFMDRAQQMRQRAELAARQQDIYEVGRPVMEAKAQADLAVAQGTLANAQAVQNLRTKFGADSTQAQKDFEDAMQAGSYQQITDALSQVGQKYAYFNLIPEGKPFIDTVKNYQLQNHNDAILNRHTLANLDVQDEEHNNRMAELQLRGQQTAALYRDSLRGLSPDAKNEVQAQRLEDQGDTEGAARLRAITTRKGTAPAGPITRSGQVSKFNQAIQDADAKALQAEDDGDTETAARWHTESANQTQAKQNYLVRPAGQNPDFSHWTGGAPANPGGTGVPGAKTPAGKAPAKLYQVDPVSKSVTLAPTIKDPKDVLTALNQAVNDGVITADAARAQLLKLGFKPKQ